MSISRMKFFTLKNFLDFLPITLFFFLLGVYAAFGMSLLFHNDRIFSELIPFTFLFIIDGFLKHHNSKEKEKKYGFC